MTRDIHCRDSVIDCDSDTESDTSDAESRASRNIKRQNAVDSSSSNGSSSSSSNPFGYIRYYNPQTGSEREVTNYESFIDHGEQLSINSGPTVVPDVPKKPSVLLVSTANILLQKQYSEESEASSCFPEPKPYMACEDLTHLDGSVKLNTLHIPERYVPTTRQSCPTKLVGNKFNQSSLTTIYIPSWSNSDNNITSKSKSNEDIAKRKGGNSKENSSCSSTTHSSSLELPVNTLPLPDKMVAELLYNFDGEFTKSESVESDFTEHSSKTVIKPPTMFEGRAINDVKVVPQTVSLNLENVGFRKHSINSDKPKRRSSIQINPQDLKKNSDIRRCVSSRFLQMSNPTTSRQSFCRCCRESCHSPRSSDSGMAGSCTLISPDIVNDLASCSAQERCSTDMANLFHKYNNFGQFDGDANAISLSDIEARDFESQCPCTSPFGSTPRTSGQDCVNENVLTGSRDSLRTSVTSSIDINPKTWGSQPKLHSKIYIEPKAVPDPSVKEWKSGPQKSHSMSCLLEEGQDEEVAENEEEGPLMYKSGLYAHWWLKAKIPASVIKGIYLDSRSPTTGKGMCGEHCFFCEELALRSLNFLTVCLCVLALACTSNFANKLKHSYFRLTVSYITPPLPILAQLNLDVIQFGYFCVLKSDKSYIQQFFY